ncbi:hypothetical protein NFK84_11850 [Enterobacter ludwigii]|uniref:hypothetical protein n=1 Tax=Enterobacter ludwigii TaxID=299767 RepID=UPI00242BF622|nr:hypothetical protein [Enterobacter ludwigii]WGA06970.1 hypothetical protein NFK84_11850 [Enterobacter ludwigii]
MRFSRIDADTIDGVFLGQRPDDLGLFGKPHTFPLITLVDSKLPSALKKFAFSIGEVERGVSVKCDLSSSHEKWNETKTSIMMTTRLSQKEIMLMTVGLATDEPGRYYTFQSNLPSGEYFQFRPRNPPLNSKPIVDDESGMCIGYSVAQAPGLWQIYDSDGVFIRLEEAPLEAPLIDPTDLALIAFGAFRLFRAGKALLESGVKTAVTVRLSEATISLLRGRLKMGLSAQSLKMTETPAKHMLNPGRYVPLQLQEKVIRYGKRTPDPQKVPGLFRYESEIYKLVENRAEKGTYIYKKYTLEVLVREKDWTITHFLYK